MDGTLRPRNSPHNAKEIAMSKGADMPTGWDGCSRRRGSTATMRFADGERVDFQKEHIFGRYGRVLPVLDQKPSNGKERPTQRIPELACPLWHPYPTSTFPDWKFEVIFQLVGLISPTLCYHHSACQTPSTQHGWAPSACLATHTETDARPDSAQLAAKKHSNGWETPTARRHTSHRQ